MITKASDVAAVVAAIDPDALTATTHDSDWVKADQFHRYMAIVQAGALGTSATLDAKIQQATDASGTGAKDVSGLAITQLTQAGSDDDKQAVINVNADDLDDAGGFYWFRLRITVATATSDGAGIILGINPRYAPAADSDLASVDEIVG